MTASQIEACKALNCDMDKVLMALDSAHQIKGQEYQMRLHRFLNFTCVKISLSFQDPKKNFQRIVLYDQSFFIDKDLLGADGKVKVAFKHIFELVDFAEVEKGLEKMVNNLADYFGLPPIDMHLNGTQQKQLPTIKN